MPAYMQTDVQRYPLLRRLWQGICAYTAGAWVVGASASALPPIAPPPKASAQPAPISALAIYPSIYVNAYPKDSKLPFYTVGDAVYANLPVLQALGIHIQAPDCAVPASAVPVLGLPADYFALASCTWLQHRYEAGRQRLELQAPIAKLDLPSTHINLSSQSPAHALSKPAFSTVLNYDLSSAGSVGGTGAGRSMGAYTQWRWGTPWGYLESNHVLNHSAGSSTHQRLDTYWRSMWPEQGLNLTLGDISSSQLGGNSGSRMAGVQVSSSYASRPWLQTLPQTVFSGSTELPSTLDLYLNGIKQYSQEIGAGTYDLNLPPSISQAGVAQIVTRDALGRQTTVDLPLYDSTGLLAPGLQEWSIEAGVLRLAQGAGPTYGRDPVLSGTWRGGLHRRLTLQVHGEATRQYTQTGLALRATSSLPQQLGLDWGLSKYQGRTGQTISLFGSSNYAQWSWAAGLSHSSTHFATLGSTLATQGSTGTTGVSGRTQAYIHTGWRTPSWGNFSLGRIWSRRLGQVQDIWSLNWNKSLGLGGSLNAGLSYDRRDPSQRLAVIGLSFQLGQNLSATTSLSRQPGLRTWQAQVQKNLQGLGSWGWSVGGQGDSAQTGQNLHLGVQHMHQYGDADAQLWRDSGGGSHWQANWRGGLVWMDASLHAARTVTDSFALVSTNGAADIPVRWQNNFVGRTDASGKLLIPSLAAYQNNLISIDSSKLPANRRSPNSRTTVVPYEKSGTKINFDVVTVQAWTFTLRDAQGQVLAPGSVVQDAQQRTLTVVGFDGRVYLENAGAAPHALTLFAAESHANSTGLGARCRFTLDAAHAQVNAFVHDFGELICQPM